MRTGHDYSRGAIVLELTQWSRIAYRVCPFGISWRGDWVMLWYGLKLATGMLVLRPSGRALL